MKEGPASARPPPDGAHGGGAAILSTPVYVLGLPEMWDSGSLTSPIPYVWGMYQTHHENGDATGGSCQDGECSPRPSAIPPSCP